MEKRRVCMREVHSVTELVPELSVAVGILVQLVLYTHTLQDKIPEDSEFTLVGFSRMEWVRQMDCHSVKRHPCISTLLFQLRSISIPSSKVWHSAPERVNSTSTAPFSKLVYFALDVLTKLSFRALHPSTCFIFVLNRVW